MSSEPAGERDARDLERIFNDCFADEYATTLEGDGHEPLYVTSPDRGRKSHRVIYREDYFSSALHEIAHWCIAGAARRHLDDYGYWYDPDGRGSEEQRAFEAAEARPQALESIFAELCAHAFHLSADNLDGGAGPSRDFAEAVAREKQRFESRGLPPRAARFADALRAHWSGANAQDIASHADAIASPRDEPASADAGTAD